MDDSHYVVVKLDFNELSQAEQLLANLKARVWNSPAVSPALHGAPQTRILETVA